MRKLMLILVPTFIFCIFLFLRLFNYQERIYIENDNSRDAAIAQYAVDHHKLPQIGQFTSSGPFFYGPYWYWMLIAFSYLIPGTLNQWYSVFILSLVFFVLIFRLGNKIAGIRFGYICLLLTAISPVQINNTLSVWNPTIIPLLSLLTLILFVKLIDEHKDKYIFALALIIGTAITIHLQSLLLMPILLLAFILSRLSYKSLIWMVTGFLIPFIPLIYFDMRHYYFNARNFLDYFLHGQYTIYIPNRWLTYAFDYWPNAWSSLIGVNKWVSLAIIILTAILIAANIVFYLLKIKKVKLTLTKNKFIRQFVSSNKYFFWISLIFISEVILFRYYRGNRYQYISFFALPAVILLTSFTVQYLFKINKLIGMIFLLLIVINAIDFNMTGLSSQKINISEVKRIKEDIYSRYPKIKFDIYGCSGNEGNYLAYPLAYLMYKDNRNTPEGKKIGICYDTINKKYAWEDINTPIDKNSGWWNRTVQNVYEETTEWWILNPPNP